MRPKKEPRESFGSTLRQDIMNDLRELSDNTGTPISKLLDQAVELLLQHKGIKRGKVTPISKFNEDGKMHIDIKLDE